MSDDFDLDSWDDEEISSSSSYVIDSNDSSGFDAKLVGGEGRGGDPLDEAAIIEHCITSRVYFAEVVLGCVLEEWQYEVCVALDNGATRISIRSGNGAGKTCLLAILILHYILFRNDVKIPVTAPSSGQLHDGLIPECRKWMNKLPDFLLRLLDKTKDRIVRKDSPEQNFVSFRTARKETPEALQGIHAEFVMCVVDEASAVPDEVYEAAQGTMSTPGAIFIMISNPTRLSGYFYRSHHRNKADWTKFHVTSFDTSRVDESFVKQIRTDYGEQSDQYRVKVLGEFPTKEEQTLIANDIVRSSFKRNIALSKSADEVWGVDVGRGGDLSALVKRRLNVIHDVKTQNYSDTMATVGWVKAEYDNAAVKPATIFVDSIGIGAGVADRLRELGLPAVDVNVGESPSLKSKYPKMRDELWWTTKDWFESLNVAVVLPEDDETLYDKIEVELCTPLQLFTSSGKDAVETKSQLRQRGFASPNIADAVCLTFAYDSAVGAGLHSTSQSAWKKPLETHEPAGVW